MESSASPSISAQLVAFLRTVYEATFRPRRFLTRWSEAPASYWSSARLLAVNGLLVGWVFYLHRAVGMFKQAEQAMGTSRIASLAMDALSALLPIVVVWAGVLGVRIGARAGGLRGRGWDEAKRVAAFLSATYVVITPPALAVALLVPSLYVAMNVAMIVTEAVYMALGVKRIYGLERGPRVRAAAVAMAVQYALAFAFMMVFDVVVFVLLAATGNLPPRP